jgi:SAM-dependent methyltransferase
VSLLDDEKLFYERFWTLHRDAGLLAILHQFSLEAFRRSSVLEGFEAFITANGFGGDLCVEIGTWKGLTGIVLARHFRHVVSIDVVEDPDRQRIAAFAQADNIRFVTVKDNAEKAALINSLDFDGAYVDGDHIRDTESDFAAVERCGQVLFHEHWPAQPAVVALVDRLRPRGRVVTAGKLALWRS